MLSKEELDLIIRHERNLKSKYQPHNNECYRYYYQKLMVKDLGISTPPRLTTLNSILGWATAAVDVILERIKLTGFYSPNDEPEIAQLNRLHRENNVEAIQDASTKDMGITGISFLSVAPGDTDSGEPEALIRPESPNEVTGDINYRTGEMKNAFKLVSVGDFWLGTLWLPNVTIQLRKSKSSDVWEEVGERDEHNLGEVHVVAAPNEADTQYPLGRSDISPALRSHVDSGMRVILGTEIAREFFGQPLRAITGATKEDFIDEETGEQINPWSLIASKFIALPGKDGDSDGASITQLPASNPENIMGLLANFGRLAARECGVAPSYFGFDSVNPSSSDAMNFADFKLLNKVYRRQPAVARAWKLANRYALRLLNGTVMENWADVEPIFVRPEAASPAAAADRMSKLIASGVFDRELPDFIYRDLGMREVEILQLKQWLQNNAGADLVKSLIAQNTPPAITAAPVEAPVITPETQEAALVVDEAGE